MITDACYEPESRDRICGLGGVLIDALNGSTFFFSCVLDEPQRFILGEPNKKQIIFEGETLVAVLAYNIWTEYFSGRKRFLFVDNEGTRFS